MGTNPAPRPWNDRFAHLVYTGNFYPEKRDPQPVFDALAAAPALHDRL